MLLSLTGDTDSLKLHSVAFSIAGRGLICSVNYDSVQSNVTLPSTIDEAFGLSTPGALSQLWINPVRKVDR